MLLSASQKNNAVEVQRLIDEGIPPSHSNVVGQTSLHISALWGTVEAMEVLIAAGADVNARNQIAGMTPLHCAIRGTFQSFRETHQRRLECVRLLLGAGADAALEDAKGKGAFGSIDDAIAETKSRSMGDIEDEMNDMKEALNGAGGTISPLARCIDALDAEGVKEYIAGEQDDLTKDADDRGVNKAELNKGLLSVMQKFKLLFLDKDCGDGHTCESLRGIIHCLLKAGADPNAHPMFSDTPYPLSEAPLHIISLIMCTANAFLPASIAKEIIQDLLSHGAKISSVTMDLLPAAAHRGTLGAVRYLTETVGVDPNFRGRQGMTTLILASRGGKVDIVKFLVEIDSMDASITDNAGKKAIDYALANKKTEIVGLLRGQS